MIITEVFGRDRLNIYKNDYRMAYSENGIKTVAQADINEALLYASDLEKGREAILIHNSFDEVPQRFINCLDAKSYIRPHMHIVPNQWELMCWLSGKLIALIFDNNGIVINKVLMDENNVKIIEIPPFCYHSFVAIGTGSYLEIRNCKYHLSMDRLYSSWSPQERSVQAKYYQKMLSMAKIGDKLVI